MVAGPVPRFLALVGPTASGKTALSLAVAGAVRGEIVSMDSRQVYRGMDVGTDKVALVDRARVPHHGLDLLDPDQRYSAGRFARDARRWIGSIEARGRTPVIVGGTGFFLRALVEPLFAEPELDEGRLRALRTWLTCQPRDRLEGWVRRLDPERADLAIAGGAQRLTRTLEVALLTGRALSWWHRSGPAQAPGIAGYIVRLDLPRDVLDRRIRARVRSMVERGLVDEVQRLLDAGYRRTDPGMTGTGYREIAAHLHGEGTLDAALETTVVRTRRYARRQLTWFRHQPPTPDLRIDATRALEGQVATVLQAWAGAKDGRGTAVAKEGSR